MKEVKPSTQGEPTIVSQRAQKMSDFVASIVSSIGSLDEVADGAVQVRDEGTDYTGHHKIVRIYDFGETGLHRDDATYSKKHENQRYLTDAVSYLQGFFGREHVVIFGDKKGEHQHVTVRRVNHGDHRRD